MLCFPLHAYVFYAMNINTAPCSDCILSVSQCRDRHRGKQNDARFTMSGKVNPERILRVLEVVHKRHICITSMTRKSEVLLLVYIDTLITGFSCVFIFVLMLIFLFVPVLVFIALVTLAFVEREGNELISKLPVFSCHLT